LLKKIDQEKTHTQKGDGGFNIADSNRRNAPESSPVESETEDQSAPQKEIQDLKDKNVNENNFVPRPTAREKNPDLQTTCTAETQKATLIQPPTPRDFNIPEGEEEFNQMINGMMKCGIKCSQAEANIKTRRTAFNKALREYDRDNKPHAMKRSTNKGRKSSF
jgi:hypothetical protein